MLESLLLRLLRALACAHHCCGTAVLTTPNQTAALNLMHSKASGDLLILSCHHWLLWCASAALLKHLLLQLGSIMFDASLPVQTCHNGDLSMSTAAVVCFPAYVLKQMLLLLCTAKGVLQHLLFRFRLVTPIT